MPPWCVRIGISKHIDPETEMRSDFKDKLLRIGNGVRGNGVRNRCPYRRWGADTEFPYRLFSLIFCRGESVEAELSHWFWRHRGSILNFRIGFLSSIQGRLPYPCLPTPFPILRNLTQNIWEVLNGVGVDGVGVSFSFFYAFFPLFTRFFPFFFAFLCFS